MLDLGKEQNIAMLLLTGITILADNTVGRYRD